MAKNKSSCSSSSSVCHSPPPLFTATSGGGFWLGKAEPCLSLSAFSLLPPSRLLSFLSFSHSALNSEFGVVVFWVKPCGGSWVLCELWV
uniref:Uncharacterized protein n=1 Tax=Fagus sylvatica TaxID=28930 RepID=A0A2N9IM32_FAGSY